MTPSLSSTGSKCLTSTYPPITSPHSETPEPLAVTSTPRSGPFCGPWAEVRVWPGPPSCSGALGETLTLECRFEAPPAAKVTWLQVCPRRYRGDTWSCSWPQEVPAAGEGLQVGGNGGVSTLSFRHLEHNHSGLYFCRVEFGKAAAQSCGTFVRVRGEWGSLGGIWGIFGGLTDSPGLAEPVPVPFLDLGEATKNRILTAQGVLLLLCAAGPGLLLLFRVRRGREGGPPPFIPVPASLISVLTTLIPPGTHKSLSGYP